MLTEKQKLPKYINNTFFYYINGQKNVKFAIFNGQF